MKTAECVSPKHPDKMCDQISDAILDYCLSKDKDARVAVETMGGHGKVYITGEISANSGDIYSYDMYQDLIKIVKRIVMQEDIEIKINLIKQSSEIAHGVDAGGAGDQGIMVGYACNDNEEMIPQEMYLARNLCKFIYSKYPYDGKTQITINDDKEITTIVASFQHVDSITLEELCNKWKNNYRYNIENLKIYCNPAGNWSQGGFDADTGLTGRKLAIDNYGPQIPIGGGAFSGKDPSKVDRSGAYMARYIAVNLLKRYPDAKDCLVKMAYAIGIAEPVMITSEMTFNGTENKLVSQIVDGFDCTPNGIIDFLDLKKPQFEEMAKWGHFGRDFIWN